MRRCLSIALLLLLSACRPQVETVTVYAPAEDGDHYVNNAVPVFFKGNFYCMWQSSATDEDAPDTHLVYSRSHDGRRCAAPQTLAPSTDSAFASAGGWMAFGDTLVAFVNLLSDIEAGGTAHYCTSADGVVWSALQPVRMADGTQLNGILEQPYEAFTVKKYAELIEKSEVRRKESDNKTSIRTKYYYALHEAFLKVYPVEMKFNNQ